jgi:3-deoxy-D-manno-octulosonic-acid transferase
VAYLGGGYTKTGVHNVLEPATFGIPILIGPNYYEFIGAIDLVKNRACFVVNNSNELSLCLDEFFHLHEMRKEVGKRREKYVVDKIGATLKILNYIDIER